MTNRPDLDDDRVRAVDIVAADAAGIDDRFSQRLLDPTTGAPHCTLNYIRTPSGGSSPEGLHTHDVDQVFYVLAGTMQIEIDGRHSTVTRDSVILFPAGVPHRNWNDGPEPTIHLAFSTPAPDPSRPFAKRVG